MKSEKIKENSVCLLFEHTGLANKTIIIYDQRQLSQSKVIRIP